MTLLLKNIFERYKHFDFKVAVILTELQSDDFVVFIDFLHFQ